MSGGSRRSVEVSGRATDVSGGSRLVEVSGRVTGVHPYGIWFHGCINVARIPPDVCLWCVHFPLWYLRHWNNNMTVIIIIVIAMKSPNIIRASHSGSAVLSSWPRHFISDPRVSRWKMGFTRLHGPVIMKLQLKQKSQAPSAAPLREPYLLVAHM